ncbi:MAG: arginine decarboxylase, pyruvoyl-dependent [Deltaproteobacteria bacterium CG_4_10_14_0_2_um_filter_43_8]|nr:MAG: arginine decarboxylase, pyruvoyl-dependent [Deltaproteobacteria bacterium CG11_big_fil_rev_8_21_14_0_20_42_23]PJA21870.1 MAG: arginine decarboxylase, pyruvoyl-dependent [Deltaproteobacteria bacterium CG_4_10_14_0_2_um_filter_43_8]PJC64366.1 MAG: arginine decarboxylase, pyruvoyl-dependent [Deltaproteobacteria bacterium CG_4_9_14_0_2_um_filter_42_21]
MPGYVPKRFFFTKGVGRHREKLQSFEHALRDAGIAPFNLVRVSSILPPHCKIVQRNKGVLHLNPGQIVHCVLSDVATNEPHRLIAASVGISLPKNEDHHGYISEHHSSGQTEKQAGDYAEDLAAEMLATTLGVQFDAEKDWNERKGTWTISGEIVKTTAVTQSAVGDKSGLWTTVVAGVVFVP